MKQERKPSLMRSLRLRFVLLATLAAFLLLGLIDSVVLVHSYRQIARKADHLLELVETNPESPELGDSRYFSVTLYPTSRETDLSHTTLVQEKQALRLARQVSVSNTTAGFLECYRYRVVHRLGDTQILFLSRRLPLESFREIRNQLLLVSLTGLFLTAVILTLLSRRIVAPLVEANEKQKAFVTSASHALKTPVAAILGDAQLLQMDLEDNEWLQDIEKQAKHLAEMTQALVTLSRCDEGIRQGKMIFFPISDLAEDVLSSFRSLAEGSCRQLQVSVTPGLSYCGDEQALRELFTILLDNAFRYCPDTGSISFSLEKRHRGLLLTVRNSARNIRPEELSHFTDRFYRGSTSENIPGSGLGLAIAQSIVQRHGGKLTVSAPDHHQVAITIIL